MSRPSSLSSESNFDLSARRKTQGRGKKDEEDEPSDDEDERKKKPRLSASSGHFDDPLVIDSSPEDPDDSDFVDADTPPSTSRRLSSRKTTKVQTARAVAGPLPAALAALIDNRAFNGSNSIKWFSMAKLQAKAQVVLGLCGTVPDSYTTKAQPNTRIFIPRVCGCLIPSPRGKKERPELKMTEPFIVTIAQKRLIEANRGVGRGQLSNSTITINANSSTILISKAVRVHSLMYAAHNNIVWDTEQVINGKTVQMEVSHLCHNGDQGCVNPVHLSLEPKEINLARRWCWLALNCGVPGCGGTIIGNICQGHGNKPDGTPYPLCIKAVPHVPCAHYTAHAVIAALP